MSLKLRPYQKENSKQITTQLEAGKDVIYQLPTGGGKTVVINDIIQKVLSGELKFQSKKILILIHRREIIFQMYQRLIDSNIDVGYLIGMKKKNTNAQVLIGSIQTITREARLEMVLEGDYDFVIIDEAHHARSGSYDKVIDTLKEKNSNMKLLGVTATPNRNDKKELSKYFGFMVKGPTVQELQALGFLSKSITYLADLSDLNEVVDSPNADYKIAELSAYMRNPHIIGKAIELYEEKAKGEQMLVFCVDVDHLHTVEKAYRDAGYKNVHSITGSTKTSLREKIIKDYKEGKIDILLSIETLTEGTDLPDTKVIQLLRPTKSQELYLQIVGRGLRVKSDGGILKVLDIANCSKEHGLCDANREWSLNKNEMRNSRKKMKIVGKRKDGTLTDDISEISIDGLEVEEMSIEDFILRSSNSVKRAEESNDELLTQLVKLINNVGEKILNHLPKGWEFIKEEFNRHQNFENIRLKYKMSGSTTDGVILSLNGDNPKLEDNRYSWKSSLSDMDWWVELAGIVKIIKQPKIRKDLIQLYEKTSTLGEAYIDIASLKNMIAEKKREEIEIKINKAFSEGVFEFQFNGDFWSDDYNKNTMSRVNGIYFEEKRPRLKNSQKISFIKDGFKRETCNLKKESIIDLFEHMKKEL